MGSNWGCGWSENYRQVTGQTAQSKALGRAQLAEGRWPFADRWNIWRCCVSTGCTKHVNKHQIQETPIGKSWIWLIYFMSVVSYIICHVLWINKLVCIGINCIGLNRNCNGLKWYVCFLFNPDSLEIIALATISAKCKSHCSCYVLWHVSDDKCTRGRSLLFMWIHT